MKRVCFFLLFVLSFFVLSLGAAQTSQQSNSTFVNIRNTVPLVTVGSEQSGVWVPNGDEFEFRLEERSHVRLWLFSPTIDVRQVGDERFGVGMLETEFILSNPNTGEVVGQARALAKPSGWLLLSDQELEAGRYVLQSFVHGTGKNAFLPLLEVAGERVALRSVRPTINVASAFSSLGITFELPGPPEHCALQIYDGDGAEELHLRLIDATGRRSDVPVPDDRSTLLHPLPQTPGSYGIEVRQPEDAYQATNAVRFMVVCDEVAVPLTVVTDQTFMTPDPAVAIVPNAEAQIAPTVTLPRPAVTVETAPVRPLPQPEDTPEPPTATAVTASNLTVERTLSHREMLPCQVAEVALTVRNDGDAPGRYELLEAVPPGFLLLESGGAAVTDLNETTLYWQGTVKPGEETTQRYRLELLPTASSQATLRATLAGDSSAEDAGTVEQKQLTLGLEPLSEAPFYAGDEVELRLIVDNPLDREVTVNLDRALARLEVLDAPETLQVPANGRVEATLRVRLGDAGVNVLQLTPYTCAEGGLERVPSGTPALFRTSVEEVPELPAPTQRTTVTVDVAAYGLPVIDGLVLVQDLPAGVSYLANSTLVNGERAADPEEAEDALVFRLPTSTGQVSFTVLHERAYAAKKSDSSLLVLTPEPEVLIGRADALDLLADATPLTTEVAVRERVGAVILTPAEGTVSYSGSSQVVVDTPLGSSVSLFVNDVLVPETQVGETTLDPELGRQTFVYLGVSLQEGPNVLRLEGVADGETFTDEVTLYLAGVPDSVTITPIDALVADSAAPLRFELRVSDAYGNAPADSFVTVEVEGATPALEDANPQQVGYQVAFEDGRGVLALEPLDQPGEVTLTPIIGTSPDTQRFEVRSGLRPWIVNGFGSVGASYGDGFDFGVSGSAFARGSIFGDYLLTVAANYPLDPIGLYGSDPYSTAFETFPVPGTSGAYNQDAYSRHGVYVRLENDLSYVQYGDFTTELEGDLLELTRPYTGLSAVYQPNEEGFGVRAYAARAATSDRVTDLYLPADGTREYTLPNRNIVPETLRLEVVKGDCAAPRDFVQNGDPLLRPLQAGVDYVVDSSGIVRLTSRLPLADAQGNCYYLKANYQLESGESSEFDVQFGAQAFYDFGFLTLRAGAYQEGESGDAFSRVVAAGVSVEADGLEADAEVAYGGDESDSGVAASVRVSYVQGPLTSEARYRFYSDGYRAAGQTGELGGHDLNASATYAITPDLVVAAETELRSYGEDGTRQFGVSLLGGYLSDAELRLGGALLGRDAGVRFGVSYDAPRSGAAGLSALAGVSLRDVLGLNGSQVVITHRQALSAEVRSTTDFSVAYRLLDNLVVRLTDRLEWGSGNTLILGLEAGFENSRILGLFCRTLDCELNDPSVRLGTTQVTAQYELEGGISDAAGRVRLGVDTQYPVGDNLSFTAGASQTVDFDDADNSETVLSAGATYDNRDTLRAEAAYDVRFGVNVKHFLFSGTTFALSERLYGSVTADYLYDGSLEGGDLQGFKFSVAGAYRGDALSVLTNHTLRSGRYGPEGETELTGDTRANLPVTKRWSVRGGYLYRFTEATGYQDQVSLGATVNVWSGGSVTGYGRLFHDWRNDAFGLGATLEVSQRLGCGTYGTGGLNLFDGVDRDRGAVFGRPGVFLRFDVVFDEAWRCGAGSVTGYVFVDADQDGVRDAGEIGVAGVRVQLYSAEGERLETTFTDKEGSYRFTRVSPGTYGVRLERPHPYTFSRTNDEDFSKRLRVGFGERVTLDVSLRGEEVQP